MNLRSLQTFVATAESGNLGSASRRLHLSQPAASRQIHSLEAELGVPLFQRVGRGLQLTGEGEDLLRYCRQLLANIDTLADRARTLKGGQAGTLKVGATPHVIASVMAPFLRRYHRRFPGVEVVLVEGGGSQQPTRLERGELHLAIMPTGIDERMTGRLLYPVYALAVMHTGHPLSKGGILDVSELSDEPMLLLRQEFGSREWFAAASQLANSSPRVRLESATPHTLIELAAEGHGVAVVPSTVSIQNERVRARPLVQRKRPLGRWSMVAWNPERLLPAFGQRFVDELIDFAETRCPGREFIKHAPPMVRPALATT